jgi:hypothetical protein
LEVEVLVELVYQIQTEVVGVKAVFQEQVLLSRVLAATPAPAVMPIHQLLVEVEVRLPEELLIIPVVQVEV